MTARKSGWLNDDVTSAASAVRRPATARQQVRATPACDTAACSAAAAPASSWSALEAPAPPTSRSIDNTAFPVCAAQPASVHASLASQDQSTTRTSSQSLPPSVSSLLSVNSFCTVARLYSVRVSNVHCYTECASLKLCSSRLKYIQFQRRNTEVQFKHNENWKFYSYFHIENYAFKKQARDRCFILAACPLPMMRLL